MYYKFCSCITTDLINLSMHGHKYTFKFSTTLLHQNHRTPSPINNNTCPTQILHRHHRHTRTSPQIQRP